MVEVEERVMEVDMELVVKSFIGKIVAAGV